MRENKTFFRASCENFKKIPGSRIAYWVGEKTLDAFGSATRLADDCETRKGLATSDNDRFLRLWFEVEQRNVCYGCLSNEVSKSRAEKWYPYNKGGSFRKWYGNNEFVINWWHDGYEIRNFRTLDGRLRSRPQNLQYNFSVSLEWTKISSENFSARLSDGGALFDDASAICHHKSKEHLLLILGFLNSISAAEILHIFNPTNNVQIGDIGYLPIKKMPIDGICERIKWLISLSRADWDEYETSWDFKVNPLVSAAKDRSQSAEAREATAQELSTNHSPLTTLWERVFSRRMKCAARMKELEEENNRLFIKAYGLEDELKPDVAWKDVSLTGNPFYRYKVDATDAAVAGTDADATSASLPVRVPPEWTARACADAVRELISYGIGCLMGRYSLAKEGLILASQGETVANYWRKVASGEGVVDSGEGVVASEDKPQKLTTSHSSLTTTHYPLTTTTTLSPDDDGIIPLVSGETAFTDNAPQRIVDFIRVAFGEENLTANLNFIEATLGLPLEDYLAKEFWNDHKRMYKNRPIYWLFRSKKGAFQALAYLHRMDAYTVSKIRNAYLLPHVEFLRGRIAAEAARGAELTAKERARLKKMQQAMDECLEYEGRLHVVADRMEAIDLDDGVLANYAKFGDVLAKLK